MKKWAAVKAFAAASVLMFGSVSVSNAETFYVPKVPKGLTGTAAASVQAAVDAAVSGVDEIVVVNGTQAGAEISKSVTIRGLTKNGRRMATIGVSRKVPGPTVLTDAGVRTAGFVLLQGSEGTTIQDLKFKKLDLPIYGNGADQIRIANCEITKPVQGITVWDGSNWVITGNIIKDLMTKGGGGLGIALGSRDKTSASNSVTLNSVYGKLTISKADLGLFIGAGIALIADVGTGIAPDLSGAQGTSNIVDVTARPTESKTTGDPLICGIMLNQLGDDPMSGCFVHDNTFAATNFGKTKYQKLEKPDGIETCNNTFPAALTLLSSEEGSPYTRSLLSVRPL
jgi:hypothetical protein